MQTRIVRWWVGLAVLGLLLTASTQAADDEPRKVALLVGVNEYTTRILIDKPLQYAERDVEELAALLREQGFAVTTLIGARATKEGIDEAVKALLKGRAASDIVLLGFSGHGVQLPLVDAQGKALKDDQDQPLSDAYLCPVNAVDASLKNKIGSKYPTASSSKSDDGYAFTAPVGRFAANGWGLHDMHGNVLEWCLDSYDGAYFKDSPVDDPLGPSEARERVIRGGSWNGLGGSCRSAFRGQSVPGIRSGNLGFRVARVSSE